MAGHALIDTHLADLRRRLPASRFDELADGLTETYEHNLRSGLNPDTAASRAIDDFGTIEQISAAFTENAPGRRAAVALLASGPVVGGCWAASLITAQAWTWPLPLYAPVAFGAILLATIALLAIVAANNASYPRTRLTTLSGITTILLDAALLIAALTVAPVLVWPMALAVPASLTRIGYTLRAVPRIIAN